jgi:hypothetical protein
MLHEMRSPTKAELEECSAAGNPLAELFEPLRIVYLADIQQNKRLCDLADTAIESRRQIRPVRGEMGDRDLTRVLPRDE